jgi:16S rRNA pseudouridine516 synthase
VRLDRFISNTTRLSRTETQRAIRGGRVTVSGSEVRNPAHQVVATELIALDGQPLAAAQPRYFMLNKPVGYICATHDATHPTVLDLLHEARPVGLHPAGRLDIDTTGLVLITDDGAWSHRVTAPRRAGPKRDRVTLAEPLAATAADHFTSGVLLKGESKPTRPALLQVLTPQEVLLTIQEGRYHQVKRMFAAVGNHVVALHRESIGPIELDPELAPGDYRPLTPGEIAALQP